MGRLLRRTLLASAAVGLSVVLAAPLAGAKASDWTTYHHDDQRTADAVMAPGKTFTSFTPAWTWHIPQGISAQTLYGEPLIAGGVVYVASNSNWVYALSASSGKLLWQVRVGPPEHSQGNGVCGDIRPYLGIVSTPVIDLSRQELFVVAAIATDTDHRIPVRTLFGLNLQTGAIELSRDVEPQPGSPNPYLLQRAALAEVDNQIVIGFGGNDGDCGNYHGWLVSTAADSSSTAVHRYKVTSDKVNPGDDGGAIWMGGAAPTIDTSGNLLVATGNSNWYQDCPSGVGAPFDDSDSVLSLSPTMGLLDYFEPSSFGYDNCHDLDLGSGAPQLLEAGLVLQIGKTHVGYLLHADNLGHATAPAGSFTVCSGGQDNGAAAIISQTATQSVLAVPCSSGLEKVTISSSPSVSGSVNWTVSSTGPPILAEGDLFAIEPSTSNSTLVELSPSGTIVRQRQIGPVMNHFATPAAGDGILVAAASGEVFAFKPTGP